MQLFKNNARSTLAASLATGATTITVATGEGARFPVISNGNFFLATIEDATTVEIVKVTGRATDTMTIERQQEGTTSPATFASGAVVSLRLTAAVVETMINHVNGPDGVHAAGAVTVTPTGNLAADTVQGALVELQGDIDAHGADTDAAHAASAIANTPSGNLAATNVQAALNELQADVDTRALSAFTPTGGIAADTVHGAIAELDTDKEPANANLAKLNVAQTWTAQQTPKSGVLTDGGSITWDCDTNGQIVKVTLGGIRTMAAPSNVAENAVYVLRVHQDATGNRSLYWNSAYKFELGIDPAVTSTANAVDIFTFIGGASNVMYCVGQAYKVS